MTTLLKRITLLVRIAMFRLLLLPIARMMRARLASLFLTESRTPRDDMAGLHELGVPLAFFAGANSWEMWSLRSDGPATCEGCAVERDRNNSSTIIRKISPLDQSFAPRLGREQKVRGNLILWTRGFFPLWRKRQASGCGSFSKTCSAIQWTPST